MSDSAVMIRAPRPADYAAMVAIEEACFSDPWEASNFQQLANSTGEHCRVAERDGQVVGYWVGTRIDDEAELANLAVDPSIRRAGVGARLVEDFLDQVGNSRIAYLHDFRLMTLLMVLLLPLVFLIRNPDDLPGAASKGATGKKAA